MPQVLSDKDLVIEKQRRFVFSAAKDLKVVEIIFFLSIILVTGHTILIVPVMSVMKNLLGL